MSANIKIFSKFETAGFKCDSGNFEINTSLTLSNLTGLIRADSGLFSVDSHTYLTNVLTSAHILVGNGSNIATDVVVSGDITIGNTGITAIGVNKVVDTMIRQSSGLSIVGRSANTTGNVSDITGTDGQVLRVSGTSLGFGTIAAAGIASDAVTTVKILNSNVTLAKIANIADQTILGNNTGGAAAPVALTASQTRTVLGLGTGDSPTFNGLNISGLTASTALALDASKNVISVTITGTGSSVYSASPTLTGTITCAIINSSGNCDFSGQVRLDSPVAMGNHAIDTTADLLIQSNGTMTGTDQASLQITSLCASTATARAGQLYLNGRSVNSSFTSALYQVIRIDGGSYGASHSITTLEGIRVENQIKGTTNYALVTKKGMVNLGDILTVASATFSNAAYTVPTVAAGTASINYVGQTGTMSASRVVNLPAASNFPRGTFLTIADESGTTTATNTIVITAAGSDKINGAASKTIGATGGYNYCTLVSDGTSKWTIVGAG
jgi:hypothetical protein